MARSTKRDIERRWKEDQRRQYRQTIKALREKARKEKAERARRLKEAKRHCDDRVKKAKQRAQAAFDKARAAALKAQKAATKARNAAREEARRAARDKCELEAAHIREEQAAKIREAKEKEAAERAFWKQFKHTEKVQRGHARARKKKIAATAKERRAESDDLVRQNLSVRPELLPVFERVKRNIKADRHRSRTEVFLDWIHDNPDELNQDPEALAAQIDREEREYWERERRERNGRAMFEDAEEVPF